jgi:type IV pilus assembly protein PilY1
MRTTFLISILAACVVAGAIAPASGQTCEYPLFIQQGSVDANVMFLFDSSGSMNEAITHDAYDPNRSYSGSFSRTRDYSVATDGLYSRRSFISGASTSPKAYLVDSDAGEDGIYNGNYLNWVFSHATSTQRDAIPRLTRVQLAKAAVNAVIDSADDRVRFGVFKFNGTNGYGGTMVSPMGTDRATIATQVNAIHAEGYTPLAESLVDIAEEYQTTDDDAPIQYACQRNFVVIVTDGLPTRDDAVSIVSDDGDGYFLDDVAEWLKDNDLRDDMDGLQYANTYTIGMNIDAPILAETATRGDGSYFTANNAASLSTSLQRVLRDIVNRISAGSAVAVVSTEGDAEDYLYRGKFLPSDWSGYLEAFELPYETGEEPVWEAGALLRSRSPSSRTIFTSVSGTRRDFTTAQASNLRVAMGAANDTQAGEIIRWTRGEAVTGYRDRLGWVLGDIVDSSPVAIGPPASFHRFNNYASFRSANRDRERVVYVGANDGMVHCFLAATGEELWAYIPNDQLDDLKNLAAVDYCHEFTVNLTPRVVDAYVNGAWRTMLLGGEKQGGRAYFALDVTDPRDPEFMWENNHADVVASWSQVEVVRMESTGEYWGFVGSGLNTAGEARLVAFNLEDGSLEYSDLLSDNGDVNLTTPCTAVDLDFNDFTDVMYVSDLTGNLWRVDLTGNDPVRTLLFNTGGQPIQAQPIISIDYNRDVYIYFGTGRYLEMDDMSNVDQQSYYCIIDRHDGATVDRNDLVDQSSTINEVEAAPGWFLNLSQDDGERVTEANAIVAGIVYFTTFAPNDEPCSAGGTSWLYAVQFKNGAAYDGDDDSSNDTGDGRAIEIGDGITAKPVVDIVNGQVLVQGSDTRIAVRDTLGLIRQVIVRSWQQRY